MVTNEIHSLLAEQGASTLLVDDLQAADLTELAWSGDAAHLRSIQTKLLAVARGAADYLAVRAPNGTHLIAQAEVRIRTRGRQWAVMGVETDQERTRTLYERLGYVLYDRKPDAWLVDDGKGGTRVYTTEVLLLRKSLIA